jgi:transcriptional regulator with XRE-family HTH domain
LPEADSAVRTGDQVGAYLREIRESRGLQLEDVAKATRIGKNYLIAIEEGMFEKLPNAAYVKGFLRLYAGALGLSGDEIVAMYERTTAPVTPSPAEHPQSKRPGTLRAGGRGRWILPLLLLVLVLMAAFFLQEKEQKKVAPVTPVSPQPQNVTLPPSPVQPFRSSAKAIVRGGVETAVPATDEQSGVKGEPRPKGVVLRLKFNQDSTLNITIDGTVSQHYELKAGDLIEWKAEDSFSLDLGNAGAVEAEFNGKPLKPFGASGLPVHIVLKAEGSE